MKKIGSKIKLFLDRSSLRWVLAGITSIYSIRGRGGFSRVSYQNGLWIHKGPDGIIVDRRANFSETVGKQVMKSAETWAYLYQPKQGDTIVDVGAGIGTEVAYFSRAVGPTGRVIAIEAHPKTYECLVAFCQQNQFNNVIPLNIAIQDKQGEVWIDNPEVHVSSSIMGNQSGVAVQATSLDLLLKELDIETVNFIKMNIEGAEKLAVQGMTDSIQQTQALCISCHDFLAAQNENMKTKAHVEAFLNEHQFEITPRFQAEKPWISDQVNALNPNF